MEHGVDENLIEDALNKRCALKQLINLHEVVELMNHPIDKDFINEIKNYVANLIDKTIEETTKAPPYETFQLTLKKKTKALREFDG